MLQRVVIEPQRYNFLSKSQRLFKGCEKSLCCY